MANSDSPAPTADLTALPEASASATSTPDQLDAFIRIPPTEGVLNALVVADDAIAVGGFRGPTFTSSILLLQDGSWTTAAVPDSPGQVTGMIAFGDRFIAVGNTLPDTRTGYIWDSVDGREWRVVQTIDDAALHDIAVGGEIVVAVGARLDAEMNATASVWVSTDGAAWDQARVGGAADAAMGSVAPTSTGFAAIGDRRLGEPRPFWTTIDGRSWSAIDNDLDDQLLPIDLVDTPDGYTMVGASGRSGDQHPFVATSRDGASWDRTNLSAAEGYASAVALAADRVVVAGVDADRHTKWTNVDGEWQARTYEPSGAAISALWWDAATGLIGVGARDGLQASWAFERA